MIYRLVLTPKQFVVIYELLYQVRLGNRNSYEEEITNFMINMENQGLEEALSTDLDINPPSFTMEFSDEDGLIININ